MSNDDSFHYKREDRLKGASEEVRSLADENRPRGNVFRRNRGLVIVLLDIIIILILFGIYYFFLRPSAGSKTVAGFDFELEAVYFDNDILLAVSIIRTESADSDGPVDLEIVVDGVERLKREEILPREVGEERILRDIIGLSEEPGPEGLRLEVVARLPSGETAELAARVIPGNP